MSSRLISYFYYDSRLNDYMENLKLPNICLPKLLSLTCGFILIAIHTLAQDASKINLAHMYDLKAEARINYTIVSNNPGVIIYLQVMTDNAADFMDDYAIAYQVKSTYDNQQPPYNVLGRENIVNEGDDLIFMISLPVAAAETLCIVKITNNGTRRDFYYDVPVRNKSSFDYARFYLRDAGNERPVFNANLPVGSTVKFASPQPVDKIYGFKYSIDFDAALPPMATSQMPVNKSMTIDSTFQIAPDQPFKISEEGLYFFQDDTTALEGLTLRVTTRYYPKLAQIEDLYAPIVYLSTRLEYRSLNNSENKKKAMDNFWLKIAGTKDKAKRIIRHYYRNVELSNRLFTNYKAGWKTDKGMVYIVYGPPEEVYRNEFEEIWVYDRSENMSRLRFTFAKVKSIFTKDHYDLKRDRSYEKFWYRTIDLWRKGRKGI